MRNLLAGGIALVSLTVDAHAQGRSENWTCAYSAYYGGGMVVRYIREGADLVDERFLVRYRIIEDTPEGLIAVWSGADGSGISTAVILIDKRSGEFTRSNATVPNHQGDGSISGSCMRG